MRMLNLRRGRWPRLELLALVLLAATLRVWRLDQNGYGNEYYTAGVRSMATSWHNFFYAAFDPAGFVSVDKPPLALWIQVASVKLFGFHGLSVLLPQVVEGVAAVWLVYHLVQRRFGAAAGLLAALFLAITPVSVAIDRSSNTDSCLVLVLLLAAWALMRAVEEGSRRFLLLSMALVGLGFNVKMLAAFVVLPTFVLVYVLGAPVMRRRRLGDLVLGALVLAAVSLSWVVTYELTPPADRPYAGTSDKNSVLELAVGPYGIGRFVRLTRFGPAPVSPATDQAVTAGAQPDAGVRRPVEPGSRRGWSRLFVGAPVGPLRLADGQLAGQVGWLLPFAVMGLVLGERFRRPLAPEHLALILWFTWALTYGVVYSYAGGFFHFYYLATMAPPLAALAGIGVTSLWGYYGQQGWRAGLLPATLLVTAAWQLYIEASAVGGTLDGQTWLHRALLGGVLAAAGVLLVISLRRVWSRRAGGLAAGALGIGLLALLVIPGAWALSSVLMAGHGVLPSADLSRLLAADRNADARARRFGQPMTTSKLIGFLNANRRGERYLLATSSAMLAAPIIIQTGEPVMARGGFHGLDPILIPEQLARMVEARQVRFVMVGDLSVISRRMGAETAGQPIADWVRANGRFVAPARWRSSGLGGRMALYDLRPETTLPSLPIWMRQ
jgi:4-amino-4-deoxy-L-arabinose transferase-like glycosyltransferase